MTVGIANKEGVVGAIVDRDPCHLERDHSLRQIVDREGENMPRANARSAAPKRPLEHQYRPPLTTAQIEPNRAQMAPVVGLTPQLIKPKQPRVEGRRALGRGDPKSKMMDTAGLHDQLAGVFFLSSETGSQSPSKPAKKPANMLFCCGVR